MTESSKLHGHTIKSSSENINKSSFPSDIYPTKIRNIIMKMNESLTYPVDYTACSMLSAMSTALGNTHVLRFKTEWIVKPILYIALVGRPGANKTFPLRTIFEPLVDFDMEQEKKYTEEYKQYTKQMLKYKKDKTGKDNIKCPREPIRHRFLVSDITQEAMSQALSENQRGICLYMDELAGWINNFTRYNKGSEEQFYISLFNGTYYSSDRKGNMNYTLIENPFSNVIGTLQPGIIAETFQGSRNANGFTERILYAFPDNQEKQYWTDEDLDQTYMKQWKKLMNKLIYLNYTTDKSGNIKPFIMQYDEDARKEILDWQHKWTDMINAEESDKKKSIYSKFEIYIHRFCIILQVAKWICGEGSQIIINTDTVRKSIKLVDYFKENALKIDMLMNGMPLLSKQLQLLEALPDKFSRAEGLEIAEGLDWNARTYDRFLKKMSGTYLEHYYGNYQKKFRSII